MMIPCCYEGCRAKTPSISGKNERRYLAGDIFSSFQVLIELWELSDRNDFLRKKKSRCQAGFEAVMMIQKSHISNVQKSNDVLMNLTGTKFVLNALLYLFVWLKIRGDNIRKHF